MELVVGGLSGDSASAPVEIVERKGLGHPDSICDSLAEAVSLALCRFYRERFGLVLHHNVDKVLLRGGEARSTFGGGEVLQPIDIYLAGRAARHYAGVDVPVDHIAVEACRDWLRENMRSLDPEHHVRFHCLIRPGSADLTELFARHHKARAPLANDTSIGVGYAPLGDVGDAVLAVDSAISAPDMRRSSPAFGEDTKIMAVRHGAHLQLTVACAQVARHVPAFQQYLQNKSWLVELIKATAGKVSGLQVTAQVNVADGQTPDSVYLTVTGTSAESGDDGEAGRGNRANGLITPYRPMTMESVAGKNPVTHVGKLYNVVAALVADAIVRELPEVAAANCYLVSQIGRPIDDPQLADISLRLREPAQSVPRAAVEQILRRHLDSLGRLTDELTEGTIVVGRWPLRGVAA